jgi:SWI/SNF-related matrix-associated actin-dependent regulator of chromatin subfamily A3
MESRDARGGILADDMGLGKTLVILSTVAGSLSRANAFVSRNKGQAPGSSAVVASRSTLVICPSSRMSYLPKGSESYPDTLLVLIDSWIDEIRK